MKFTGLILICATSCLALILPAIGVVQFPKSRDSQASTVSLPPTQAFPITTQSGLGAAPTNQSWSQTLPPNGQPTSPFAATLPGSPNSQAPITAQSPMDAAGQWNGAPQGDGTSSTTKFGMGLWLLLAPVCLIGLAMWTFSPNPSGTKSRV